MIVKIDYKAVGEILKVTMREPINQLVAQVAAHANANADLNRDAPGSVEVTPFTTDRAIAVVRIASPLGLALQAKHGVLTKAAAATGLEVTSK